MKRRLFLWMPQHIIFVTVCCIALFAMNIQRSESFSVRIARTWAYTSLSSTTLFATSSRSSGPSYSPKTSNTAATAIASKNELLELLEQVPRNAPTPKDLTKNILSTVRRMKCPTKDKDVLNKLLGTWELLWTTQDPDSPESKRPFFASWINPLENQSYSNNPRGAAAAAVAGRADPVLPLELQNKLEKMGILTSAGSSSSSSDNIPARLRSTQTIDGSSQQVVNVVALKTNIFGGSKPRTLSLTVLVDYVPNASDARRIDVKFQSCRVLSSPSSLGFTIPLGVFGPTGWLRTVYIDDNLRITRGHKGSVFILQRPQSATKNT